MLMNIKLKGVGFLNLFAQRANITDRGLIVAELKELLYIRISKAGLRIFIIAFLSYSVLFHC